MLEFYQAYAEYHDLMDLTEEMLRGIAQEVVGHSVINYQGEQYDFGKPFERMTVVESILHFNPGVTLAQLTTREDAVKVATDLKIPVKDSYGLGKIQIEIFEKTVESRLMNPTFITAYPVEVSPLARRNDQDPHVTDRFEFFVGGREIANGFTELNDAEDQAARFQKQVEDKRSGRSGSHALRCRLHHRPGTRDAAHGGRRHRHRPPGDAVHRCAVDPRCAVVSRTCGRKAKY